MDVDQKAAEMLRLAMNGEKTIQLVADGNGSFKRSLLPGNYYVVVRSKHREGDTSSELLGKISFQKFEVKSGDEVSVAAKFEAF